MSSPSILVKREWTPLDELASREVPGRPYARARTAHSWVDDLMECKKMVTLCSQCEHLFTSGLKRFYRKEREFPFVLADCVGCSGRMMKCAMYVHEALYTIIRSTEDERRALAISRQKRIKQGYL